MAYLVRIALRAERDLEAIYDAVNAEHSKAALRWFNGIERALYSLEVSPARCPPTPEDAQLRHLLHGKRPHVYRLIYRISEAQGTVEVLHIRHGARNLFDAGDLK